MTTEVLFLGNCQMNKFAHFYGTHTPRGDLRPRMFRSITPHYGNYAESETVEDLKTADVAVVQLILSDYIFNRDRVLEMRDGKRTIFTPYVYLPGFRRMEKIASKGELRIQGADLLRAEASRVGIRRAVINYMDGAVDGENVARFTASLDEMRRREATGADVRIADYIADTYKETIPCYAIHHPAAHVLVEMYNQIAAQAEFTPLDFDALSQADIGRATLPQGITALTPYCADALGLYYEHEPHWYATTSRLCKELQVAWEAEETAVQAAG